METFNCIKCGKSVQRATSNDIICCPHCGNKDFPEIKLVSGFQISGFELIRKIGTGAMGSVWLAKQTSMHRNVAIKILSPSIYSKKSFIERFKEEIKISAKLDHPNIVAAYDAGYENGFHYLVSAFADGDNLDDLLVQKGRIPERAILKIALGIADALSYAWNEYQMLHRDIKPSNIVLDKKNTPKLLDMGLSKCLNDEPSLTFDGEVVGTPYYMSPEQAKGSQNLDLRSDIYSLGATIYHTVTGELPFTGESSVGILTKHITEPLTPPSEKCSFISSGLNKLIIKMMEKDPEKRIQTWYEVIEAIKTILEKEGEDDTETFTTLKLKKNESSKEKELSVKLKETKHTSTPIIKPSRKKKKNYSITSVIYPAIFLIIASSLFYTIYYYWLKDNSEFNLYNYIESSVNSWLMELFNFVQINIFNNTAYENYQIHISIKQLGTDLLICLIILFSGLWSGAKAQKHHKKAIIHFIAGLLIPFIYPLIIFHIGGNDKSKSKPSSSTNNLPEKKLVKYFSKFKNAKKAANSCFEFELYNGTKIYAEYIIEVKQSLLVIQVYTDSGNSKVMRLPFSEIENFTKL